MNGFNENKVPSTHYPPISFLDETNPFPIQKEVKPMKLTIIRNDNTIEEHHLWFTGMDPAQMSSMDLAKAQFDINRITEIMEEVEIAHVKTELHKNHNYSSSSAVQVIKSLALIDDSYLDARSAIKEFNIKMQQLGLWHAGGSEDNFSPSYAFSTRALREETYNKRKNNEDIIIKSINIDEMYVSEMTGEKCGWVVRFKSATFNSKGQHYNKTWPGVLFMNKTNNGYRLMWSNNKTKTPIWGISYGMMARKKLVPFNGTIEHSMLKLRNQLIRAEDVLKIIKYMPTDYSGISAGLYPEGITQSDIYWIGGETSTKKILNKAYMHPHGVTKKIFGDINKIKTLDDLRAAIGLLQIVRGFNPQVLEKLDLLIVARYIHYNSNPVTIKHFKSFFRHFGYKDEYLLQMFAIEKQDGYGFPMGNHNGQHAVDAAHMFKQIKGRNHRTAIKQHVARSRMNIEEIHDFVNVEYSKIRTENKKLPKTRFWKTFAAFDGKWIAEGIQMIVPKMTHDLVEWGAVQNNCIGSYADRVYAGTTMVIGFKDIEGNWIGHAEVNKDLYINQLLGKHNQALSQEDYLAITTFLKRELNQTDLQTSIPMAEGYP